MCQVLYIEPDPAEMSSLPALAAHLAGLPGNPAIVWDEHFGSREIGDCCLCCVDLEATGRAAGYEVECDYAWGEVRWRKPTQPSQLNPRPGAQRFRGPRG